MDPKRIGAAGRGILATYDEARPAATAERLRELWLQAAPTIPPQLEPRQKQFFRDWGIADAGFAAVGTPVPVLIAIGREIGRQGRGAVGSYLGLARLLWEAYGREGRVVAAVALGPMELADPGRVVPVLRELARTCVFWEDCDQLAMKALEPVLRRDPESWLEPVGDWVTDENKWVRRAGLTAIGRLPMERPEYTGRCIVHLAPALGDGDMDVKRALSFAIRVAARGEVEPVRQFLQNHADVQDYDSVWVLCDVIRSMKRTLLPAFRELETVYRGWLGLADARSRKSAEAAIRALESLR